MIDKTERDKEAIANGLKFVGEICAEIGFEKRLSEITKDQMLTLVEAAVDGFHDEVPF